ncbi:MAG: HAMP domain-containing histidine kinase [Clostridium sp.]|nr:HAMP domain-containing histidine kinase [Clostridium sp.]
MEKKIKAVYMLSIVAILAFLGMQAYWLYGRYEYSLREYEDRAEALVAEAMMEYDRARARSSATVGDTIRVQSRFQMNHGVDTVGKQVRNVTVSTSLVDGRRLLGIAENRKLTPEEMARLEQLVMDSLETADAKIASVDASSAPSDGVAWNAMRNFEREIQSPFTVEGIDSILKKHSLDADISLILLDSLTWAPVVARHASSLSPNLKIITPYSELERKAVVIECGIPSSDILRQMGWTLVIALVVSLLLILCLVWQIKTIARLTRLDNMRNSFITTMIHELKRPISTLKMCVSGIDNDRLLEDASLRHELVGETRIALDNLSAYFSKLRDIAFNNVEQIPLNVTAFGLRALVDDVTKSMPLTGDKEVAFENDVPSELEISADRSHMMNILANLIENAVKYSGKEVEIRISAKRAPDGISIKVADNGKGIPSTDKDKIFNRFYRGGASATDVPGMGLGLSYVKLLTEAHGGHVAAESAEGKGSTFTITLPQ